MEINNSIMNESSTKLREIILNTKEPLILRNFKLNWSQFPKGLDEWCHKLDKYQKHPLFFEYMSKRDTNTPQWERKRKVKRMKAEEFLQILNKKEWDDYWFGLNYKRSNELPNECTNGIDFSDFGFPNAHKDCAFWLSSTGANTPCHYDTIMLRKLWLLFPPETELTPTRIPYEESSVYCLENFHAPQKKDIEKMKQFSSNSYIVELEKNDVLIVPHHWWHYVETIETSLSVNTWIPLDIDVENQIDECIVQYLMKHFTKSMEAPLIKYVLNPNQIDGLDEGNHLFDVLNFLLKQQKQKQQQEGHENSIDNMFRERSYYLSETQFQNLLKNCKETINLIPNSADKFDSVIRRNNLRCQNKKEELDSLSPLIPVEEILMTSICHPKIILKIKQEFLKRAKTI